MCGRERRELRHRGPCYGSAVMESSPEMWRFRAGPRSALIRASGRRADAGAEVDDRRGVDGQADRGADRGHVVGAHRDLEWHLERGPARADLDPEQEVVAAEGAGGRRRRRGCRRGRGPGRRAGSRPGAPEQRRSRSSPRKRATNAVAGRCQTSGAAPICSTRPACMIATRSATPKASSWSWVTNERRCIRSVVKQVPQLDHEPLAQGAVERAERLVEHEEAGRRARARGRAPRAAARRPRAPAPSGARIPRGRRAPRISRARASAVGRGATLHARSPKATLPSDVAVREQRVVLEHQPEAAAVGRHAGEVDAVAQRPARRRAARGRRPPAAACSCRCRSARARTRSRRRRRSGRRRRRRRTAPCPLRRRVRDRHALEHEHQNVPTSPTRKRSMPSTTIAVERHQDRARGHRGAEVLRRRAGRAAGRSSTGSVGRSGRAMNAVAPNSPSEIANANAAGDEQRAGRRSGGRPRARRVPGSRRAVAAASRRRGSIDRSTGAMMRTTNGIATSACAIGHEQSATSRRSSGGVSSAMRKPNPSVTAETPSGTRRGRPSSRRAERTARPRTRRARRPPPRSRSRSTRVARASCGSRPSAATNSTLPAWTLPSAR